ncbi:fibrinogen-like protein A [Antedon mediterranea]|uniref:fibrinogen-like protein A n=1 Tax=Antedon mediterranea TaxID=105859 RepID=UPI003AF992C7
MQVIHCHIITITGFQPLTKIMIQQPHHVLCHTRELGGTDYPRDCTDILESNSEATSGAYMINIHDGGEPFRVYCDMDTDGGGWTIFQRREDGSMDFYRNWAAYKAGFGNVNGEHWLGNDNIHRLTSDGHFELRVDMSTFEGGPAYAHYDNFRIGDEKSNYILTFGTYSGNAGDSLATKTMTRLHDVLWISKEPGGMVPIMIQI